MGRLRILLLVLVVGSVVSGILAEQESPTVPGKLLPGATRPGIPQVALTLGMEGEVKVRIHVSAAGEVQEVEILGIPGGTLEDWEEIKRPLESWRFEPARRDGEAVPASYNVNLPFKADWPHSLARIYPRSSKSVYKELVALFDELRFKREVQDDENQVLITKPQWRRKRGAFATLAERFEKSGFRPTRYQVHCIVPASIEPARVYCGAMTHLDGKRTAHRGPVEGWVLDRLDERLGLEGETIPASTRRRYELARKLAAGLPSDSLETGPAIRMPGVNGIGEPELIQSTRISPIFPVQDVRAGNTGKVIFQYLVQEDGVLRYRKTIEAPEEGLMGEAAQQAVAFWRYKPARLDGVPVPVFITIVVSFALETPFYTTTIEEYPIIIR